MRPDVIVVALPECGLDSRGSKDEEGVFVEKLVADPRAEALDVGVLGWLTGSDAGKAHVAFGGPLQQQMRDELGTVVGAGDLAGTLLADSFGLESPFFRRATY
jgi:hypothetical protein